MLVVSTEVARDDRCYFDCGSMATMFIAGHLCCTHCAGRAIQQWLKTREAVQTKNRQRKAVR